MVKANLTKNRSKLAAVIITVLMVLYFAPLCLASEGDGQSSDSGKIDLPGVPDNAIQYNKTNVTPVAEMEQVEAGEPVLFQYRNITMLMNCTRNCDLVVTVDSTVKPQLFGLSIDPNQTMILTMNLSGSPIEGTQTMQQSLNCYFGIEPNANIQLTVQLRLHIDQTELKQQLNREVNASLTWMYWNKTRSEWQTVDSHIDEYGYLVCNTNHFSTWTVAEISESTENGGESETTDTGMPVEYIYAGVIVVVVIAIGVGIYTTSKRGK